MNKIKLILQNKMLMLSIILLFWLAIVVGLINSYYHIVDYDDFWVTVCNRGTWVYLAIIIYELQHPNKAFLNWIFFGFSTFLTGIWIYFFKWDITDFIKNPNAGYYIFMWSPPVLTMYCCYWAVMCLMTIFGTNREAVTTV